MEKIRNKQDKTAAQLLFVCEFGKFPIQFTNKVKIGKKKRREREGNDERD